MFGLHSGVVSSCQSAVCCLLSWSPSSSRLFKLCDFKLGFHRRCSEQSRLINFINFHASKELLIHLKHSCQHRFHHHFLYHILLEMSEFQGLSQEVYACVCACMCAAGCSYLLLVHDLPKAWATTTAIVFIMEITLICFLLPPLSACCSPPILSLLLPLIHSLYIVSTSPE